MCVVCTPMADLAKAKESLKRASSLFVNASTLMRVCVCVCVYTHIHKSRTSIYILHMYVVYIMYVYII